MRLYATANDRGFNFNRFIGRRWQHASDTAAFLLFFVIELWFFDNDIKCFCTS
ncbi:MAG: hypothetical protein LBP59_14800 [Planctomycetaceae bacterium]|nr:hypothetical protein [Planctomycetaceae bacterium]